MALELPGAPQDVGDQGTEERVNPYDELVASTPATGEKDEARAKLSRSFYAAKQIKPEDAQKALEMSKTSPLPASMILRNLQNGVNQEPVPGRTEYDKILDETPRIGEWSTDPLNKSASSEKGDYEKLQDLEKLFQARTETAATPAARTPAQLEARARRLAELQAPVELKQKQTADENAAAGMPGSVDDFGRTMYAGPAAGLDTLDQVKEAIYQRRLSDLQAEEELVQGKGELGPWQTLSARFRENPLFVAPFMRGGLDLANAGGVLEAAYRVKNNQGTEFDLDLLDRVWRVESAMQRRGKTMFGKAAEMGAELPAFLIELAATGGLSTGAKVGVEGLVQGVKGKVLGKVAQIATQAALVEGQHALAGTIRRQTPGGEGQLDENGNLTFTIKDDKNEPVALSLTKEAGSALIGMAMLHVPMGPLHKFLVGEVGETTAKTLVQRVARIGKEGVAGALSGLTINEATKLANALAQVGPAYQLPSWSDVGAQLITFGGLSMVHAGMARTVESTERTLDGQRALVDSMDATGKAPHVVEDAIAAATKGTPNEFVYLPVADVKTFFQGKGLDPRTEMGKILGDPVKYDQASESELVQVPTSRYAMTIDRDPEASKFFQGKVKFDPMDASREELEAAIKGAQEGANKPAGTRQPAGQPTSEQQTEDSALKVARFIQGRMKELGYTREAETFGKVYGERYKARAERRALGEQPLELFDKMGLGIFKREGPGGEQPEGEAQYVKVLEQGGREHVERVPGATPAEAAQHAGEMFPDATIEPMTPEEVKAGFENAMGGGPREFMQPGGVPRGNVEFGHDGVDINLFRNADRSTFLHESGHLWLDDLITDASTAGVPEQLRGDLDIVLKWLGSDATALQGGREIRKSLTEAQQEKWASAVEAYLMEGKAPSAELRGVFYRFAEWLKRIYKSLTGLEQQSGQKLDLNPQVREVMDRLLATDEQIAEAKSSENVQSVLAGADWIPAADKEKLSAALAEVDRQAKEELNQKLMAQVRKEESAQYAREREAMKGPIAAEVDQLPEQVALANLERGTRPDGTPLGSDDLPAIKISRQATLDAYEGKQEALGGLPRRIFAKDGVTPDEAAEYFGFTSGDELLSSLRKLYEPQTHEAREIKTKLEGLEMQRKLLLEAKQPLEAEAEEAIKSLKAGRKTLATKLERAIRDAERSAMEPINEILKDIRDRGGIDPTNPTEDLPAPLRSRKAGKGVSSDQIAQELYDRGQLDSADSDALYKKLAEWQQQVKDSKERAAAAPKEARRLASERVSSSIEALIDNSTEQERLRVQLARLQSESATFRREHQVNQRQALIDRLADERMKEQHPDMLTDGTLPEEATKAVYNAQRSKLMARELELLVEHKLPAMKQMVSVLAKRGGFSELMRAQAEEAIAKLKDRELSPNVYRVTARKAAAEAVDAFTKGDWKGAFDAKRKELLNHELYRAAQKVREAFDSGAEYMRNLESTKVQARIGKAGGDYLERIQDILERFQFTRASNRQLDRRGNFRNWYEEQVRLAQDGEGYAPEIPDRVLDESFRKNYREMSYEEFQDVVDAAKNLEHLAGLKNRLLASADKRDFNERRDAAVESIAANSGGPRKKSLEPRAPGLELKKRGVEGFFASLRKMASLTREMDGFKDGGVMWDIFMRPANRAGNREATMQAEASEHYSKLVDEYGPSEKISMLRKEFIPEIKDSLSRWGQIMVALNSGNEGNLQRLRDGYGWSAEQIRAIHDHLTEKDWKFVRGVWELVDKYWPEIRDLNKRVTGLEPEKVEAQPFDSKYGEQPGGYFPIKYESILSPQAAEHGQAEEAKPSLLGATIRATTRHGHREARMEHVEQPMRLDPGVISDHLNQVIHDLTHYEFITDSNRLLRDPKLQKALIDHYGDQNFVQMKDWIKDIAVGTQPAKTKGEALLNWFRQGTVVARLALNLKQFITDQTGLTQAAQRIGPEWVAKGWGQLAGDALHMENGFRKIGEKSEFIRNRWRTMLREVNEATSRITKKEQLELLADVGLDKLTGGRIDVQDLRNTFFQLLAKAQMLQDGPVWLGAYEKALSEHKVESERTPADRERVEKLAVDLADQAVLDSFGGGQIKDLAQTQRGSAAWKVWTTFGSFANVTLQRNVEAWNRFSKAKWSVGSGMKLASDLALVNILPAAITTAIGYALSNNSKDKKNLKREVFADQASQFINQIPLGREFSPALHGHGYEGPAGTEIIQTGNRLLSSLIDAASKHDSRKVDWAAANQTAGSLFHYPATFVQRAANAIESSKHGAAESLKAFLGGHKRK